MTNENNSFLPDSYEVPTPIGNYMKLVEGDNTFRVLSPAIIGWEYWNTDNKPVRHNQGWSTVPEDIKYTKDGLPTAIKHFWAFIVWNYATKSVQILEITQSTVQKPIKALAKNTKWGNPTGYDITVNRSGKDLETDYSVTPNPHEEIPAEATEAFMKKPIKLEALFDGADPFAV
jgi:hypothetical protein